MAAYIKDRLFLVTLFVFFLFAFIFVLGNRLMVEASSSDLEAVLYEHIEKRMERPHRENFFRVEFKENATDLHIWSINHAMGNEIVEDFHRNLPPWLEGTPFESVRYIMVEDDDMLDQMFSYYGNSFVQKVDLSYPHELSWSVDGNRAVPNDWNVVENWYFDNIEMPEVWYRQGCHLDAVGCGGSEDIVVAVLDTGLGFTNYTANFDSWGNTFTNKEFLFASEQTGVNLWTNPTPGNGACNDVHGIDMDTWLWNRYASTKDTDDPNFCNQSDGEKEGYPLDDRGHGTFVSGLIASSTNNGLGSVGMAHNVSMMTIKLNEAFSGALYSETIEQGLYYATFNGADVINMSFGSEGMPSYGSAIDYAANNGVVLIGASGNNIATVSYPARFANVIAVGSVNIDNSLSDYSAYGPELDFVAPVGEATEPGIGAWHETLRCGNYQRSIGGSTVRGCIAEDFDSLVNDNEYIIRYAIGTSYAAPQVAAAAALALGYDSTLSPAGVKDVLTETVDYLGTTGTGDGVLNVNNLYEYFHDDKEYVLEYIAGVHGSLQGETLQIFSDSYPYYGVDGTAVEAVADVGYDFIKWDDDVTDNPRQDLAVTGDLTVTALFDVSEFTLIYTAGNNGSLIGNTTQVVGYGNDGTAVEASPSEGYYFVKWSDDAVANPRTDTNVTSDVDVTALFAPLSGEDWDFYLDYTVTDGDLYVDIVDGTVGSAVANPIVDFGQGDFSNDPTSVDGTLGTESESIRLFNYTSNPAWTLNLAAANVSNKWVSGPNSYSFNHPTDANLGRLSVFPDVANMSSDVGCNYTNLSLGSEAEFQEGILDSIDLMVGSELAPPYCRFDLRGVGLNQVVPGSQPVGTYSIEMVLTVTATPTGL